MKLYVGNNRPVRKSATAPKTIFDKMAEYHASYRSHEIDLRAFVGCVTVTNPATGQHRTFRIRRQADDAKFAPGQRVASLLTGPDNESDYTGFGFVTEAGHICLWRKYRDSKTYITFRNMLEEPTRYEDEHGLEYAIEKRCRRCFRRLTDPESIAANLGPECRKKA